MRRTLPLLLLAVMMMIPVGVSADANENSEAVVTDSHAIELARQIASASDPESAYLALSIAERRAVDSVLGGEGETTTVIEVPEIRPLASGCWTRTNTKKSTSVGVHQHTIKQILEWCGNGSTITSTHDWFEVSTGTFWQYDSIIDHWTTGGVGWGTYRVHRQAYFKYCPPLLPCPSQSHYPVVDQQGSGDGSYWEN